MSVQNRPAALWFLGRRETQRQTRTRFNATDVSSCLTVSKIVWLGRVPAFAGMTLWRDGRV